MKYTLSLILVISPLFVVANTVQGTVSDLPGGKEIEKDVPVQSSSGTLTFVVNPTLSGERDNLQSSDREEQFSFSCREQCVLTCCLPLFLHCAGVFICCEKYCCKKS